MGHDMMLDPNWEAVASRIVHWLVDRPPARACATPVPGRPTRDL
jgi:hypothetical protein